MKILTLDQLDQFFTRISETWELRLPVLLPDGTRAIAPFTSAPPALLGGAVPGKPTAAFFPQQASVFTVYDGALQEPQTPDRPLFIIGFTPRDLACLRFIDRFFADGWRDDIYFRQRQHAVVAGLSGLCGPNGAMIPPAGGDCDLEFFFDGSNWLVVPYSEAGQAIVASLPDSSSPKTLELFRQASAQPEDENEILIKRASELLQADRVPDSFWAEIGERCIACTGCNLACPTCTCFGVQDWRSARQTERSRMWDSCQLDGFMREASGHNPLGSEALRTRRRIHHKLAADPEKWGEISCFLCGRCDAVCPTGIGMVAVARELVTRFGLTESKYLVTGG
ncbi:MAG: 4Fe-4S dicluster domain-containing protein [Deltaproteobacteria bacterium]|nr:4Fe-4S dicluster domain-containing protein [Deltaproteobacteria bacterium]